MLNFNIIDDLPYDSKFLQSAKGKLYKNTMLTRRESIPKQLQNY